MKVIEWLKKLFQGKQAVPEQPHQADGFKIIDSQQHIHTKEKI